MVEMVTKYCELPPEIKLERQCGVKKYSFEDLDKFCKEKYGKDYGSDVAACYDPQSDCCVVTYPIEKKGPGFWITFRY